MELPSIIPIFPLPNVVLFPGVPLPLHVFEDRYREMVSDTKDGDGIIGMTLLRGDWRERYLGNPEVFASGCAGRIVSVESLPDGKFNILLHGVREFVIEREMRTRSYRLAEVRWRPGPPSDVCLADDVRQRLIDRLDEYACAHLDEPIRKLLNDPTLGDILLVNFFCYALDVPPLEKQGLLEAANLDLRALGLLEILEFHSYLPRRPPGKPPLPGSRSH